jgi:hypothetical protein
MIKEFRLNRVINDLKINSHQIDASVIKILETFLLTKTRLTINKLYINYTEELYKNYINIRN